MSSGFGAFSSFAGFGGDNNNDSTAEESGGFGLFPSFTGFGGDNNNDNEPAEESTGSGFLGFAGFGGDNSNDNEPSEETPSGGFGFPGFAGFGGDNNDSGVDDPAEESAGRVAFPSFSGDFGENSGSSTATSNDTPGESSSSSGGFGWITSNIPGFGGDAEEPSPSTPESPAATTETTSSGGFGWITSNIPGFGGDAGESSPSTSESPGTATETTSSSGGFGWITSNIPGFGGDTGGSPSSTSESPETTDAGGGSSPASGGGGFGLSTFTNMVPGFGGGESTTTTSSQVATESGGFAFPSFIPGFGGDDNEDEGFSVPGFGSGITGNDLMGGNACTWNRRQVLTTSTSDWASTAGRLWSSLTEDGSADLGLATVSPMSGQYEENFWLPSSVCEPVHEDQKSCFVRGRKSEYTLPCTVQSSTDLAEQFSSNDGMMVVDFETFNCTAPLPTSSSYVVGAELKIQAKAEVNLVDELVDQATIDLHKDNFVLKSCELTLQTAESPLAEGEQFDYTLLLSDQQPSIKTLLIGLVAGGSALFLLFFCLIFCCCCRRRKRRHGGGRRKAKKLSKYADLETGERQTKNPVKKLVKRKKKKNQQQQEDAYESDSFGTHEDNDLSMEQYEYSE